MHVHAHILSNDQSVILSPSAEIHTMSSKTHTKSSKMVLDDKMQVILTTRWWAAICLRQWQRWWLGVVQLCLGSFTAHF